MDVVVWSRTDQTRQRTGQMSGQVGGQRNRGKAEPERGEEEAHRCAGDLPLRLGKGVAFSLAALLGRARLERLKLVPWFLYRLPAKTHSAIT